MSIITCKVIINSTSQHLIQLYTGFSILRKVGIINLKQEFTKKSILKTKKTSNFKNHAYLEVILNDEIKLFYDLKDTSHINTDHLSNCDFYFKRSLCSIELSNIKDQKGKIYPLGFKYPVYPDFFDKYFLSRAVINDRGIKKLKNSLRTFDINNWIHFSPRINNTQDLPNLHAENKILFVTRAWDPTTLEGKNNDRIKINEKRAFCIKLLKKELPNHFYGGFIHSEYSKKKYSELLIPDNQLTSKKCYLKLVKSFPICITTSGLLGSVGSKFGEYIAMSKAIVSEEINKIAPGDFRVNNNYLPFVSPDECLIQVDRLLTDKSLRNSLMINSAKYYHKYLRPDSLILNSLITALSDFKL